MDDKTRREIDKAVEGILKDAGLTEPPVKVAELLQHLEVHREFYVSKIRIFFRDFCTECG